MRRASSGWKLALAVLMTASAWLAAAGAHAEDKLLNEIVEFNGVMLFLNSHAPGMIIGAVRNGETAVFGFGQVSDGSAKEPNGETMLRIGSITKAFTGQVLAGLVDRGTVKLTDPLRDRLRRAPPGPGAGGEPP